MEQPTVRNPYTEMLRQGVGGDNGKLKNPYTQMLKQYGPQQDKEEGTFEHMWNLTKYAGHALASPGFRERLLQPFLPLGSQAKTQFQEENAQVGQALGETGKKFLDKPFGYDSDMSQSEFNDWMAPKVIGVIAAPFQLAKQSVTDTGSLVTGLADLFIKTPLEFISKTRMGPEGEAVPASPAEQAKAIQDVVGLAAQILITKKFAKLPNPVGEEALLMEENLSRTGRLWKVVKSEVPANLAGGATYGAISGIGSDDHIDQIINNSIGMLPLGLAFSVFGYRQLGKDIRNEAFKYRLNNLEKLGPELGALTDLRTNAQKPLGELITANQAIQESNTLVEAGIRNNITNGKGFISPPLTPEQLNDIRLRLKHPRKGDVITYTPDEKMAEKLKNQRRNLAGAVYLPLEFWDEFDRAAYLVRNGKNPKKVPGLLEDLVSQTGLDINTIASHGKNVATKARDLTRRRVYGDLTQEQVESVRRAIITQGQERVQALPEAGQVKDAAGQIWTRVGNKLVHEDHAVPITSNFALEIIGRDPRQMLPDVDALSPTIPLEKQLFDPATSTGLPDFDIFEAKDGTILFHPPGLHPEVVDFFKKSGFMPQERVVFQGHEYKVIEHKDGESVKLENLSNGKQRWIKGKNIKRLDNPLVSEISTNPDVVHMGVLNPENYFSAMYDRFKTQFNLNGKPVASFNDAFMKFANDMGVKSPGDIANLQASFYKRLNSDIVATMPEAERLVYTEIQDALEKLHDSQRADIGRLAAREALQGGYYMTSEGGGRYLLKDSQGNLIAEVGSPEEVLKLIKKQQPAIDLTGGNSNPVPPQAMGNPGPGVGTIPHELAVADRFALSSVGAKLTPVRHLVASMDNVAGTNLLMGMLEPLQTAINTYKRMVSGPVVKSMEGVYNEAVKYAKEHKFTADQLSVISDYMEMLSADEVKQKLMARPMSPTEILQAEEFAKVDIYKALDYMRTVKEEAKWAKVGTQEFEAARLKLRGQWKDVADAGDKLFQMIQIRNSSFEPLAIIRLAQALSAPHTNVTRAEFAARSHPAFGNRPLPSEAIKLAEKFDRMYNLGATAFGIGDEAKINGYLPHARIAQVTEWAPHVPKPGDISTQFIHELSRVGILGNASLIRDPLVLAHKYIYSGAKAKSGLREAIKLAKDELAKQINEPGRNPELTKPAGDILLRYLDEVDGKALPEQRMQTAIQTFFKTNKWVPGPGSVMAVVESAFQGLRPFYAVSRDIISATIVSNTLYGPEFTAKALGRAVPKGYIAQLMRENKIPTISGFEMMLPYIDREAAGSWAGPLGDFAMKSSGQHWIYNKILAGVYRTTNEIVDDVLKEYNKNKLKMQPEAAKQIAFDNLKMDMHTTAIQDYVKRIWDNSPNFHEETANILGQWNGRNIAGAYGNFNAPIGMSSAFGRAFGQFGHWGMNMMQVFMNAASRGTPKQRMMRGIRFTTTSAAIGLAGAAAGVDLSSWLVNPVGLLRVGPLPYMVGELGSAIGLASSPDSDRSNYGQNTLGRYIPDYPNAGHPFIPFSYAIQDWMKGYQAWDEGYGPRAIARALGVQLDRDE